MAKLIHNKKVILNNMKYAKNVLEISRGLMFANNKKIEKGICMVMPSVKNTRLGSSVTMLFCFSSYEIIFVNSKMNVVDKVILKPFRFNYTPKKPAKYIIESCVGTFKNIKINDIIKIEK